ncbi:hypothetical protein INT45_012099 [Circinella minor]|uniref:Uncharacterized protein n=1 Tax=Circinella minor TaxID=1195481 RepID=A0A8H7SCB5_9FUNG|nr:hypothetical protein INT45_012099 [Circinella minor]
MVNIKDPISYIFNRLPKSPPTASLRQRYYNIVWPKVCYLLHQWHRTCRPNQYTTSSSSTSRQFGQLFLEWIKPSAKPFSASPQLRDQLSIEFPAILTHYCAISNNLINILRPCIQHGMGIANFHEMLQELHTKRHTILHMKYTLAHLYCKETQQTLFESWNNSKNKNKYYELSTFDDDAQGYGGYIPSVTYFRLIYTAILDVLCPFMDKQ